MSAEIHQLPPGDDTPDGADSSPRPASGSVYLDAYLAPFRQWLERDTVTEIIVNRPGEIWIEDAEHPGMRRVRAPTIDDKLVQRLAEQVARVSHQGINREHPLLGATLPDGARIQFCGPPATRRPDTASTSSPTLGSWVVRIEMVPVPRITHELLWVQMPVQVLR